MFQKEHTYFPQDIAVHDHGSFECLVHHREPGAVDVVGLSFFQIILTVLQCPHQCLE